MLTAPSSTTPSTVVADFIDLKSPYMGGHSRRCARARGDAARVLGLAEDAVAALRRAALVHDFGTTVRAELDLGQARPAHARRSSIGSSCTRC